MTQQSPTPFDPASLTYNDKGLIPAIAQADGTGEVLMMAWMNAAALAETLVFGRVTDVALARVQGLKKGETSGHIQRLVEMRVSAIDAGGAECATPGVECRFEHDGRMVNLLDPQAIIRRVALETGEHR